MHELKIRVLIIATLSAVGFVWIWLYTRREKKRKG
jgi:hypothetical protein